MIKELILECFPGKIAYFWSKICIFTHCHRFCSGDSGSTIPSRTLFYRWVFAHSNDQIFDQRLSPPPLNIKKFISFFLFVYPFTNFLLLVPIKFSMNKRFLQTSMTFDNLQTKWIFNEWNHKLIFVIWTHVRLSLSVDRPSKQHDYYIIGHG